MPMALARSMTARTIAESTGFSTMPCTKVRSTLTSCTGNCFRYASEEWPVPKSSMASRMPSWTSFLMTSRAAAWADSPLSWNWRGERLTLIGRSTPSRSLIERTCRYAVSTSRGEVHVTVAYGGAIYATLPAVQLGLAVTPECLGDLITLGREVKWALND